VMAALGGHTGRQADTSGQKKEETVHPGCCGEEEEGTTDEEAYPLAPFLYLSEPVS
jgi:hypothetical protein